jgi:hypothetical protein
MEVDDEVVADENTPSCFNWGKSASTHPAYARQLQKDSGIHILQQSRVEQAFEREGDMGLFNLFITVDFINCIWQWTQENLSSSATITIEEIHAYIGLELAMSLVQPNSISDYWAKNRMFSGHPLRRDGTQHVPEDPCIPTVPL